MVGKRPQISPDYLDIGRQNIFPNDCFVTPTEPTTMYSVLAVEHAPDRGLVIETEDDVEFWTENEVIDIVADGTYDHWRLLAVETEPRVDDSGEHTGEFVAYMFAVERPSGLRVMTGVGVAEPNLGVMPDQIEEWVETPRIEFKANEFEAVPDWLRDHDEVVELVSRLLWEATSTAKHCQYDDLFEDTSVDNPYR